MDMGMEDKVAGIVEGHKVDMQEEDMVGACHLHQARVVTWEDSHILDMDKGREEVAQVSQEALVC
jgi:hypothetical protein